MWLLRELPKVFGVTLAELARQAGLQDIEGAADGDWILGLGSLPPDEQQRIRDELRRAGTIGPAFGGL